MDDKPKLSEPGRHLHPLEPSPERTEMPIEELADNNCRNCHGQGLIRVGSVRKGAPAYPVPCTCAEKGYKKFMEQRTKLPCRYCGKTGWCDHRPRTLRQLFMDLVKQDAATRAGLAPRPAHNVKHGRKHGQGSQPQGGQPDQQGPVRSFGWEQAGDRGSQGRPGPLPGLQPGSPDPTGDA